MKPHSYRPLPGKARTLISTSTLWLTDDHILLVKSSRLAEEYRRFYFPDVQAIVLRRQWPFHYWWAAFLFIVVVLVARFTGNVGATAGVIVLFATFLVLRGPTAVCHIYTAVGREALPSLHRVKTARRVVELLSAEIEQRQGSVQAIPDLPAPAALHPAPPPLPDTQQPMSQVPRPASARYHAILFSTLLAEALFVAAAMFSVASWPPAAIVTVTMTEFALLVPLLAWQTGKTLLYELKAATWVAAGRWMLIQFAGWLSLYKAALFDRSRRDINPLSLPITQGWFGWMSLSTLLLVSLAGLYFAWAHSRASIDEGERA